jgi:hypothetical protein
MAQLFWKSSSSGNWSTASDWSGGAVPTASDDVTIAVAGITVTVSTGTLAVNSITTTSSVLAVTGGTLAIGSYVNLGGNYQQSGGLVSVANGGSFTGSFTESAGTFDIANNANFAGGYTQSGGLVTCSTSGTFAGDFTSTAGTLLLESQGASFTANVTLGGGKIEDLGRSFLETGNFTETKGTLAIAGTGGQFTANLDEAGGTIDMMSGTLGLGGAVSQIYGTLTGNGTLVVEGELNGLNGTTTIEKNAVLSIGRVDVLSGVLALAATTTYKGYFLSSTSGTVNLGGNTLILAGGADLSGQISGGGTVNVSGTGQLNGVTLNNSAVLDITSAVTVVPFQNQIGTLTLENNSEILIATGASLSLTGSDSINDISANGTLYNYGLLSHGSNPGTAEITSSFVQEAKGTISVGLGTIDFSGSSNTFTTSQISGAGTLSLGAVYTGQPTAFTFSTGSTLAIANFELEGRTTQDQLTLNVAPNTNTKLAGTFTYLGNWAQSGGLFLFGYPSSAPGSEPGPVLDLFGSVILDGGVIKSSTGTINTTGLVSLGNNQNYQLGVDIEGFTNFDVSGTVRQDASIQFGAQSGSKPTATILGTTSTSSAGTWYLEDGASITGPYGEVVNDGTIDKNIGSGVSSIDGELFNNGLLEIAASQVLLDGSGVLAGTISGQGQLDFEGNGTYMLQSTLALTVGHVLVDNTPFGQNASVVALNGNISYAGVWGQHGGVVELGTDTLTLSGETALDGGTLTGTAPSGTLVAAGATTLGGDPNGTFTLGSYATLDITKTAEQSTNISISSLGTLNIAVGATYTIDDTESIYGSGTVSIEGTLVSNGAGFTTIDPNVVASGSITVSEGTLAFLGGVSGGIFTIDGGAQLDLDNSVTANSISGSATTITMSGAHASLLIGDAAAYEGVISGFVSTDFIEISQLQSGYISDTLSDGGKMLTISDSSNHTFTLTFAQALTASQLQIADGPNGYIGVYHV